MLDPSLPNMATMFDPSLPGIATLRDPSRPNMATMSMSMFDPSLTGHEAGSRAGAHGAVGAAAETFDAADTVVS